MKKLTALLASLVALALAQPLWAADYVIDTEGAHASINFKISHIGFSFLVGRFDDFAGTFSYDPEKPGDTKVEVVIKTDSINSNHAERDKHLRSEDYLATNKYPEATFKSTRFVTQDGQSGKLHGQLTLRGVTRDVVIDVEKVGEGEDPWGGYRVGFAGKTKLTLADFGIPSDLGPAAREVELSLHVEGLRQD